MPAMHPIGTPTREMGGCCNDHRRWGDFANIWFALRHWLLGIIKRDWVARTVNCDRIALDRCDLVVCSDGCSG